MSDRQEQDFGEIGVNLGIEPLNEGILSSEEDKNNLIEYLSTEINDVLGNKERERLVKKWQKWRRISEARPEEEEKNYPWDKASNVTVPITMTTTNGLYALLKATYGQKRPFFTITPTADQNSWQAKSITKTLDILAESSDHLNIRRTNNTIFYDLIRLGTQFVKVPWITDSYTFKRYDSNGGVENVTKVRRNSATVIPMRIEDALTRPYWPDIQSAPWFGHHVHLFDFQLLQRQQMGVFDPEAVETVLEAESTRFDESMLEDLDRRGIDPAAQDTRIRSIVETYLFWDVDGDGIPEDVIVWFHPETETILRIEYNDLGHRPIVRIPYINLPYQLYGIGTGWMCEGLQDEADALHNMRVNAEHIHSLQMYATKRGGALQGKLEFRPLKNIQLDNPRDDFQIIQFPGIGYENLQAEMLAKEYADRATGANDYMMGFENKAIGTRSTFAGTAFLAQQGNKIFDAITESVNEAYGEIGQVAFFQLLRNRDAVERSILPMLSEEDQAVMREVLNIAVEDIPQLFHFRVETTDAEKTEQVMTQQKMLLFQLYSTYAEKVFQLLPMLYSPQAQIPPQMKEVGGRFFVGATKLMEEIFRHFDEKETSDYLPYVKDIDLMLDYLTQQKEAQVGAARQRLQGTQPEPATGTQGGPVEYGGSSGQSGMAMGEEGSI